MGRIVFLVLIAGMLAISCSENYKVNISEDQDEGQECFRIELENATLYYQKGAGGFSSIVDKEGNDWLGFRKDTIQGYPDNAASEYRGLPNLVFQSEDSGAGHPGSDQCHSNQSAPNQIRTESQSGKWAWTWTFHADHAVMHVEKTDPGHSYWFLYEGIPGGRYQPQYQYWGTDQGGPNEQIPDYYFNNAVYDTWQWAYFGHRAVHRVFYIVHHQDDDLTDTFSYLGNTEDGVISPDGMVVFGFGRDRDAETLLKDPGQIFTFGFYEKAILTNQDHEDLGKMIRRHIK